MPVVIGFALPSNRLMSGRSTDPYAVRPPSTV